MLSNIKVASISNRIALGPRTGQKVRRIGSSFGYEEEIPKISGYGCASMNGFSLHAATAVKAHERSQLKKLLGYAGRGPVSNDRFSLDDDGNVLYKLKNSYDGASHILLSPLELMEKISGIIPPPRKHQVTYYGCFSSHNKMRSLIAPNINNKGLESLPKGSKIPIVQSEGHESSSQIEESGDSNDKKSNYIPWMELLKRTFQIDLSVCKNCGGRLKVISMIKEFKTVKKILDHLGLGSDPPVISPSKHCSEDFFPA